MFKPEKKPGGGIVVYPQFSSPENVLQALKLAYENRDSSIMYTIYDSTYVGESTDLNEPPGSQVITFNYFDEISHVGALQRSTTISFVSLDMGPQIAWDRLPSDDFSHPDWAVIQRSNVKVEVTDGADLYQVDTGTDVFTFKFKPITPEQASPTDTLWRIVAWRETKTSGNP